MNKWKENEYVIEAMAAVAEAEKDLVEHQALFDKYSKQVEAIDPELFVWLEEGFRMHMFYTNMTIDNNNDFLSDSYHTYKNRVAGAKKAAETRKAKKLQAA